MSRSSGVPPVPMPIPAVPGEDMPGGREMGTGTRVPEDGLRLCRHASVERCLLGTPLPATGVDGSPEGPCLRSLENAASEGALTPAWVALVDVAEVGAEMVKVLGPGPEDPPAPAPLRVRLANALERGDMPKLWPAAGEALGDPPPPEAPVPAWWCPWSLVESERESERLECRVKGSLRLDDDVEGPGCSATA